MRYQIITDGHGDTHRAGYNDAATIETTVGPEAGLIAWVTDGGDVRLRSGLLIKRQDIVNMAIDRRHSYAIDAVVDGLYQRTLERNVREENVEARVAELAAQPNLSRVRAYPEAF